MPVEVITKRDLEGLFERLQEMERALAERIQALDRQQAANGRRLLTSKEVAAILGIHKGHLWRLIRKGSAPRPLYIDSKPRWWEEDLVAWIESRPRDHLSYQQQAACSRGDE